METGLDGASRAFEDIGKILSTLAILAAVIGFLGRPILDKLWVWLMRRNRVNLKALVDKLYIERFTRIDKAVSMVDDHNDRIDMLFEAQKAQGEALVEQQKEFAESHSKALERIADTLNSVHREAQASANAISHIYGLLKEKPWDGTERRNRG